MSLLLAPDRAEICWREERIELPWGQLLDRHHREGSWTTPDGWFVSCHRITRTRQGTPWGTAVVVKGELLERTRDLVRSMPPAHPLGRLFTRRVHDRREFDVIPLNVRGWSDETKKDDASRSTVTALVTVLASKPDLRLRLADEERTTRLAARLAAGATDHSLVWPAGIRRPTTEIWTAMRALGYEHPFGRPLPSDQLPPLDDAVTRILAAIASNPHAAGVKVTRRQAMNVVGKQYLDIEPWPFEPLTD